MAATAVRYHLDESVTVAVVRPLQLRGIDVTTPADAGLLEAPDEDQLEFAADNKRVLVTHYADFLALHQTSEHAGIAYCHQRKHSIGGLLQMLVLLHGCFSADEMRNQVEYL